MTKVYIFLLSAFLFSGLAFSGAYAQQDDELQRKAEQVLQSEPGAQKVTVREEVTPKEIPNGEGINFMSFDLNGDGVLAQDEVGERLFQIFDRDGNEVIDNKEMKEPSLLVFTPMTKKTIEIIEYNAADMPQKTSVSEEEFLQKTQLGKFDKDADGLSPLDFLGMPFIRVNVKRDDVIDLYEWKRAYASSVRPMHEEQFHYN